MLMAYSTPTPLVRQTSQYSTFSKYINKKIENLSIVNKLRRKLMASGLEIVVGLECCWNHCRYSTKLGGEMSKCLLVLLP